MIIHLPGRLPALIFAFILISVQALLQSGCSKNTQLQPLAEDATILAFGDSLTYGSGTSRDNAYPAVLARLIKRKVINAGVPGEVSSKGLQRLPALLDQYQPELLIICHGGNDILKKQDMTVASDNIQKMINLARDKNIQVVLIGVPEFGLFLSTSPIYKTLADENGLPIENDALGYILGKNSLKSDHVHPNSKGYQILAEKIRDLLVTSSALSSD